MKIFRKVFLKEFSEDSLNTLFDYSQISFHQRFLEKTNKKNLEGLYGVIESEVPRNLSGSVCAIEYEEKK